MVVPTAIYVNPGSSLRVTGEPTAESVIVLIER